MSAASPAEAVVTADGVERSGAPSTGIYQIGSITKVVTGLLLAREVVEGALSLGQPVSDLLPELVAVPAGSATLGALASHTSGLPRLPPGLWRKAIGTGRRDPYADIDGPALVAALQGVRLRRPGGPAAYSNLGYGLLGHALAVHRETTYDAAVRDRITGPLGMADTACVPMDRSRVVPGTARRGKPHPVAWGFDALAGAGALWSTVDDLVVFLRAQLEPPEGPLGEAMRLSHRPLVGGRVEVALAWMRLSGKGGALLWHNGGTAGYRSFVGLDHGRQRAVVVLGSSDRSVDRRGMTLVRDQ